MLYALYGSGNDLTETTISKTIAASFVIERKSEKPAELSLDHVLQLNLASGFHSEIVHGI